jgi:hypothetical protein
VNGNPVPKANRPICAGQRPRALQSPPRRCYLRGKFMRRLPQQRSSSSAGSRYYENLPHQQRANVAALGKSRATNDSSYLLKIPFHLVGGQQRRSAETFSRHRIHPRTPVGRCRYHAEPLCGAQPGEYTLASSPLPALTELVEQDQRNQGRAVVARPNHLEEKRWKQVDNNRSRGDTQGGRLQNRKKHGGPIMRRLQPRLRPNLDGM